MTESELHMLDTIALAVAKLTSLVGEIVIDMTALKGQIKELKEEVEQLKKDTYRLDRQASYISNQFGEK